MQRGVVEIPHLPLGVDVEAARQQPADGRDVALADGDMQRDRIGAVGADPGFRIEQDPRTDRLPRTGPAPLVPTAALGLWLVLIGLAAGIAGRLLVLGRDQLLAAAHDRFCTCIHAARGRQR